MSSCSSESPEVLRAPALDPTRSGRRAGSTARQRARQQVAANPYCWSTLEPCARAPQRAAVVEPGGAGAQVHHLEVGPAGGGARGPAGTTARRGHMTKHREHAAAARHSAGQQNGTCAARIQAAATTQAQPPPWQRTRPLSAARSCSPPCLPRSLPRSLSATPPPTLPLMLTLYRASPPPTATTTPTLPGRSGPSLASLKRAKSGASTTGVPGRMRPLSPLDS